MPFVNKYSAGIILKSIKVAYFFKSVFEKLLDYTGPFFVFFGSGLISFAIYVHFMVVLPWYNEGPIFKMNFSSLLHFIISAWLMVGIAWNYTQSVIKRPFKIEFNLTHEEIELLASQPQESNKGQSRFCKTCTSFVRV